MMLAVSPALAEGAPLQLPSAKPAAAAAAIANSAVPAKIATVDAATAITRANAYFNNTTTLVGDFVQIGADGRRSEGKLYVQKPGRLRFEYAAPATLEIVADGKSVAIRDRKLATQDLYFIWQTPLKFLLSPQIDLARDTKVLDVGSDQDFDLDHRRGHGYSRWHIPHSPGVRFRHFHPQAMVGHRPAGI